VDDVIVQHQRHIVQDAFEERFGLPALQPHGVERRRGQQLIPDETHQDGVFAHLIRLGHIRTGGVQGFQGLELVRQPGLVADLLTVHAALALGFEHAQVDDAVAGLVQHLPIEPVKVILLQVAKLARPENLGCQEGRLDRLTADTLVNRGFLAAFHHAQDVGDPAPLVEAAQRGQ